MKSKKNLIILGALALLAGSYWFMQFLGGPLSPAGLAARALSSSVKSEDRVNAVIELSLMESPEVVGEMQRIAKETQDPAVLAMALGSLVKKRDVNSQDQYLAALNHSDKNVRQAAIAGVRLVNGGTLPENLEFQVDGAPEARSSVANRLKAITDEDRKRMMEIGLQAAGRPVAIASADAVAKDVSPTPTPSPSPTSAPSPSASPPPMPIAEYDYPTIHLLVWMCRLLAVLVLIAEVAGLFSLIVGDRTSAVRTKAKVGAKTLTTAEEQMERLLAQMGPNHWSRIALLVGGAMSIVALLYAAEMIYLAARVEQTAVRVEQKIDYLRGR